jgi:Domain of unknown function (DUF5134)
MSVIEDLPLRWGLTVLFAIAAALFVLGGSRTESRRSVSMLHALASAAMILMLWPVGMRVSPVLYLLVFTGCTLYFAYLALFSSGLPHPVYHCTMMAAMAAMGVLMAPNAAMSVATASAAAAGPSGPRMAQMNHAGMTQGAAMHMQNPEWFAVVCTVLAVGFGATAVWWFYLLVCGPSRAYPDLLMALGMSAAFAAMAA